MSRKEKKDKKRKVNSSFFSNLNTDSTIEYGFAEKNPKSKWTKWIIAGLVLGATATGIAVPWALSSCTLSLTLPYSDREVMYRYFDPITKEWVNVTYKEFKSRIDKIQMTTSIFDKWDDVFYKTVLEELYREERNAFLKFKAIYEKLHKGDKDLKVEDFGADLSISFKEIEKNQKTILNENKKAFQKATENDSNWLEKWIKELQTNSIYGPQLAEEGSTNVSVLEEKALAYMVSEQIKNSALARYKGVSISQNSWNWIDLNFANRLPSSLDSTNEFVKCKEEQKDGTERDVSLTEQEAQRIWKSYLNNIELDVNGNLSNPGANVVQPKKTDTTDESKKKIVVFETKSYSTEYRNPISNNNLTSLIKNNYKLSLISSFTLTGLTPGEKNASPFIFTSDFLKNLFKVEIKYGNESLFVPMSRLSNFKGANLINTSRNENNDNTKSNDLDNLLIKKLSGQDTSNLGSSKLVETSSLFTASSDSNNGSDSNEDSGSSSKSTRDDSSSSSSLNMFYISALTSSSNGYNGTNNDLFSINQNNPFSEFMKILFSINDRNEIDLSFVITGNKNTEQNWNNLSYGSLQVSYSLGSFIKHLKNNLNAADFTYKNTISVDAFNTQLDNLISSLGTEDLIFLGKIFNSIMIGNAGDVNGIKMNYSDNEHFINQVGYWTLYQLSAPEQQNGNIGTYLYVSSSEIKIFSKSFSEPQLEDFQKMAINDLYKYADNSSSSEESTTINMYYDTPSIFAKLDNPNLIVINLLDPKGQNTNELVRLFGEGILDILKKDGKEHTPEIIEGIIKDFYNYARNEFYLSNDEAKGKIVSNIWNSLKTIVDSKRVYDFATIQDVNQVNQAAFQTQLKYKDQSLAIGQNAIENLFITNLQKILSPSTNIKKIMKGNYEK